MDDILIFSTWFGSASEAVKEVLGILRKNKLCVNLINVVLPKGNRVPWIHCGEWTNPYGPRKDKQL